MALGSRKDFALHRGDDRVITFVVVDQAGVAVDLTAVTLEWNFSAKNPNSVAPLGLQLLTPSKTIGAGVTLIDAVNGVVEIALDSADTTGRVAPSDFYHELQAVNVSKTTTVMYGIMSIAQDLLVPGP